MADAVPHNQAIQFVQAERIASVFSVCGCVFIITTFLSDSRFRKPINRLVFYASWGNLFTNVATLIARSGILQGLNSPLCQFQGLLIQWFMPADALWTFAMACNVWLTIFKQSDAAALRALEWKYLLFCYGTPFVPAFTFLFVSTKQRGKLYGSANLWCWVSEDWNALRIATFYGPVWVIILLNFAIYLRVGLVVFKWRQQLISIDNHSVTQQSHHALEELKSPTSTIHSTIPHDSGHYEVNIHSQVPHSPDRSRRHSFNKHSTPPPPPQQQQQQQHARYPSNATSLAAQPPIRPNTKIHHVRSKAATDANRATVSYCYTAALFFLAMLVTWVPSTINRVWTLATPAAASPFALDLVSGIVLSLQGFWNLCVYVITTLPSVKALASDISDYLVCCCQGRSGGSGRDGVAVVPGTFRRHGRGDPLGSTDTRDAGERRADIHLSLDGKNGMVKHSGGNARDYAYSPEPKIATDGYAGGSGKMGPIDEYSVGRGYGMDGSAGSGFSRTDYGIAREMRPERIPSEASSYGTAKAYNSPMPRELGHGHKRSNSSHIAEQMVDQGYWRTTE